MKCMHPCFKNILCYVRLLVSWFDFIWLRSLIIFTISRKKCFWVSSLFSLFLWSSLPSCFSRQLPKKWMTSSHVFLNGIEWPIDRAKWLHDNATHVKWYVWGNERHLLYVYTTREEIASKLCTLLYSLILWGKFSRFWVGYTLQYQSYIWLID